MNRKQEARQARHGGRRPDRGGSRPSRRGRRGAEEGTVTAEVAILLPMLMATIVFGFWVVGVVTANIRCVDAARDVARAVARGESADTARSIGERAAPPGTLVEITRDGDDIQVTVTTRKTPDWPLFKQLPAIPVEAKATIRSEPGEDQLP
jgi:Flp pilus assembly protein TadG